MGTVAGWIQAGVVPPDALMQVETILNTRQDLATGIINLANLAIVLQQHIAALEKRLVAVEAFAQIVPDPSTVF